MDNPLSTRDFDFSRSIREHLEMMKGLESEEAKLRRIADLMVETLQNEGRIFWIGNGGSASDAEHLAAELTGRFQRERASLPSIALTANSSVLTAVSNDYGYEEVFARQIEGLCGRGDVLVALSTSGRSPNVLRGVLKAREMGVVTVGITGAGGHELRTSTDVCLVVRSVSPARIQEASIFLGHCLCERIEMCLFPDAHTI